MFSSFQCSLIHRYRGSHPNSSSAIVAKTKEISPPIVNNAESTVFVETPPPDVRLVLFKELGDTSERINIFDSKIYQKVICQPQVCECSISFDLFSNEKFENKYCNLIFFPSQSNSSIFWCKGVLKTLDVKTFKELFINDEQWHKFFLKGCYYCILSLCAIFLQCFF